MSGGGGGGNNDSSSELFGARLQLILLYNLIFHYNTSYYTR